MESCKVIFFPDGKEISVLPGSDLLTTATRAGLFLQSGCGGKGTCGKCKVKVKKGKVKTRPVPYLSKEETEKGYLLACQSFLTENTEVEIPPQSRLEKMEILSTESRVSGLQIYTPAEGIEKSPARSEEKIFSFSPLVKKSYLELPVPTLDDPISDLDRISRELNKTGNFAPLKVSLPLLKGLSFLLRKGNWKITLTLAQENNFSELISVELQDKSAVNYGIALDIGTTTVVAYLLDLKSGEFLAAKASHNRQINFGEDVISRIIYAQDRSGLDQLHYAIMETVNDLILSLAMERSLTLDQITSAMVSGNPTMIHLFLKLPPGYLRKEPYVPVANSIGYLRANEVGLKINPFGVVSCLPGVSSYVGGDITAGVLASGMDNFSTLSLLIDLGTNGEIALGNKEWLVCCACSAGPAFEGVGISSGIQAMEGAIQQVSFDCPNKKVEYKTIGNKKPLGICGSGLVSLLAELLFCGIIDRSGKFIPRSFPPRIRDNEEELEFVLVNQDETANQRDIVLTQSDIVSLIHSKGAVYQGALVLLGKLGLKFENLEKVFVSGGFGTYLDIQKAIMIGLLPDMPLEKFTVLGNSSVTGAKMCLLSAEARKKSEEIARKMTYIELSVEPAFMNEYTASLFLPHTNLDLFPRVKKMLENR